MDLFIPRRFVKFRQNRQAIRRCIIFGDEADVSAILGNNGREPVVPVGREEHVLEVPVGEEVRVVVAPRGGREDPEEARRGAAVTIVPVEFVPGL